MVCESLIFTGPKKENVERIYIIRSQKVNRINFCEKRAKMVLKPLKIKLAKAYC